MGADIFNAQRMTINMVLLFWQLWPCMIILCLCKVALTFPSHLCRVQCKHFSFFLCLGSPTLSSRICSFSFDSTIVFCMSDHKENTEPLSTENSRYTCQLSTYCVNLTMRDPNVHAVGIASNKKLPDLSLLSITIWQLSIGHDWGLK